MNIVNGRQIMCIVLLLFSVACFSVRVSVTFHLHVFILFLVRFGLLSGHLGGKELLTRLTICSLCNLTICNFRYFPVWF